MLYQHHGRPLNACVPTVGPLGILSLLTSYPTHFVRSRCLLPSRISKLTSSCLSLTNAAGDWLQGPYVYALYEHYGFSVKDIGRLFIMGFGSSMIFGTIVGSLADRHGRKKAAILYVVSYGLSCVTKHSR